MKTKKEELTMYTRNHKITDSNIVFNFTELFNTIRIEKMIVSVEKINMKVRNNNR